MQCELCGRNTENILAVSIEGVEMDVCADCAKHGKRIIKPRVQRTSVTRTEAKKQQAEETVEEIIPNYSDRLRAAIGKKDVKLEHLAKRLGLKESELRHYEQGKMKPSISDAKKLEKFFNITIVETIKLKDNKPALGSDNNGRSLTIGDMIRVRKK